ncbi:hypothetical protein D3C76_1561080 [compost metagenome]
MRRFMAGSAPGNHRHAAFIPVGAHHDADSRIAIQFDEIAMRGGNEHTFNGVINQLFAVVKEESGHSFPICCLPCVKA